ncbi:MAG: hypothetical protein DCF22_05510 [Leptolyngbya sp.]|nr:MAG: hypothetical protein DCF22_05510 [Leptolyngbya sp.]
MPYLPHESEIRRYLKRLTFLGFPAQGENLEFPLFEADREALWNIKTVQDKLLWDHIRIHLDASVATRCWSPKNFAADYIKGKQMSFLMNSLQLRIA